MIYKRNSKKAPKYAGLDCSGPNMVLPPTFCGISELVRRAGSVDAAAVQYQQPSDREEESEGLVRDFLSELAYCDKAERQQLIEDFNAYVEDLADKFEKSSGDQGADPDPAKPDASGSGGTQTES